MVTNKKGYMRTWRLEKKVEIAFLVTRGTMKTIDGKPVRIHSDRNKKPEDTVFHHRIPLNGNRPNGSNARLLELEENWFNIVVTTVKYHQELHKKIEDGQTVLI